MKRSRLRYGLIHINIDRMWNTIVAYGERISDFSPGTSLDNSEKVTFKGSFSLGDCNCDCDVAKIGYIGVYVTFPTGDCDCDIAN